MRSNFCFNKRIMQSADQIANFSALCKYCAPQCDAWCENRFLLSVGLEISEVALQLYTDRLCICKKFLGKDH